MTLSVTAVSPIAGVVGWPIAHSLSPAIHNAWLNAARLDGVYVAFPVSPERFGAFVDGLRGGVIRGLNVTAPHKERALALADHRTARAEAAGAANLLILDPDGAIFAENTDGVGLLGAFAAQAPDIRLPSAKVLVLGAGGAARGALAALKDAGVANLFVASRDPTRADHLAEALGAVQAWGPGQLADAAPSLDVVINATPQGLEAATSCGLIIEALGAGAAVMDMAYRPVMTPLLTVAWRRGLRVVDGLEMLIAQARPSFQALFGSPAPRLDLRARLLAS